MSLIDGMPPRSRNHRKPPGPDTPQDLGLDSNDKVWALERLRFMDDQPLALMHNVPASVVDVGSIDLETAGLYNALRLAGVQMLVATS